MAEILQDYEQPAGRPTFITVLCILTFIGSCYGLVSSGISYYSANYQQTSIALKKEKANAELHRNRDSSQGAKFAIKMMGSLNNISPDNIRKGSMANMFGAILCLAGAVMMWNLKRIGFYLYVAGILVEIISPFVIFGGSNFMSILSSAFTGFIGLVFVILYGVNLKYMK